MINEKKLRIVFVTNNYSPYSGGVVSSIDASCTQLQQLGHEVFIVTLDFLGNNCDDHPNVIRVPCTSRFMYKKNYFAVPIAADRFVTKQLNI